jgi:hypothetical protein
MMFSIVRIIKFFLLTFFVSFSFSLSAEVVNLTCQVKGQEIFSDPKYGVDKEIIGPAFVSVKIEIEPKRHFHISINGPRDFRNSAIYFYDIDNSRNITQVVNKEMYRISEDGNGRSNTIEINRMTGLITVDLRHDASFRTSYSEFCEVAKASKF